MTGWLIYSRMEAERNRAYIEKYFSASKALSVELSLVYSEDITFGIKGNRLSLEMNGSGKLPDFAICRTIYPLLTRQLELLGVRVFNPSSVAEICNDKARTYQHVASSGVRIVDTEFVRRGQIPKIPAFPLVTKLSGGRGGSGVRLSANAEILRENISDYGEDFVSQQLCASPGKDLRVFVIGKEPVGAILRSSKTDFRANFCLGGSAERYELSPDELCTVKKIIALFDFGLVGVDFIFGAENELIFNEIEDVVGARTFYAQTDIDIAKEYLVYIKSKMQ